MEIILILIAFFVLWRVSISLAKSSDAYLEIIVNGIKPEIDKLIQNQPKTRKYNVLNLKSLQQWKKFSSEDYLKKRLEEDKYLQERIKNDIPIYKKNIADYQLSYSRILSEFRLKKPQLKWYVSFQIEKDIRQSQQRFSNSNYNNIFDIKWSYTSPRGRNSYESRSKFTIYQVSQVLSYLEENKSSKISVKYQESQITQSLSRDNISRTNTSSINNHNKNSIIDVTGQSSIIRSNGVLVKYIPGVPNWPMQYVYSYSEINIATIKQKEFYRSYKYSFLNRVYYDLEGNTNYAFILLFDLLNEYYNHKNLSTLESQFNILGTCYPKTKSYADSFLSKRRETENTLEFKNTNVYSNENYYEDYWKLGSKYKIKLNLKLDEINLLNKLNNPNDNFCNIEFCLLEVCKLYLAVFSELNIFLTQNSRSLEEELRVIADTIAKKDFKYRKGSQNYNYCTKKIMTNEFFDHIFKRCDKALREYYDIKGKINTDTYFINSINSIESYNNIISKVDDSLNSLILKVNKPTKEVEVELNSYFTTRWRVLYSYITNNYDNNNNRFVESIIELGNLNIKNPSIQNIYFDASKFICKLDREASIQFYFYYLYYDLKSPVLKNKPLTKYMYASLFSSNEQLHNFEKIVSELIRDKDLEKALKQIPEIYKVKRKKIQLNSDSIKEVIEQHSETVELLNEYLKDDFEDENNSIKSQEISNEEIQIEIIQKSEEVHQSTFVSELSFTAIHTTALQLFAKSNFSISQDEFEVFAKSKGVFKNQLIESINDTCYEFLDDVLIEEEEDYYTINTNYFQRISTK